MTYHVSFSFLLDYWSALLTGLTTTLDLLRFAPQRKLCDLQPFCF